MPYRYKVPDELAQVGIQNSIKEMGALEAIIQYTRIAYDMGYFDGRKDEKESAPLPVVPE